MEKRLRLAVLYQARKALENNGLSDVEKDELIKLLDVLILSLEKFVPPENLEGETKILTEDLISAQALLALAKQQADELDALKILSLNLTSSLDLPTVLDAVVKEAMRLGSDTRIVHIFLYRNNKLDFGASLDSKGQRNRIYSQPRKNGLTDTVARKGKIIIVDDIKKHPLYKNAPEEWNGSIVGIPLKTGDTVVGVMNLSRHNTGPFSPLELRLLHMLADQAAVAISNASLHQIVSKKAYTDTTTGLSNRRALDERMEARKEAAAKAEQQAKNRKIRQENCAVARNNLSELQQGGIKRYRLPDGTVLRLTEEDRQQRIAATEAEIAENCKD